MVGGYPASKAWRTGVNWLGFVTPLPILTIQCVSAGSWNRHRPAWLSEGGDTAGMSEPSSLGEGEGAAGLSWLLDKEPGGFRGGERPGLDLVAGKDAASDQAVETNPSLIQGVVAAASGGVGDGRQSCSNARLRS
jgi:hypothetical protein